MLQKITRHIMQRIRETFRKRQSTLDAPHSPSHKEDEKAPRSEPSSPKAATTTTRAALLEQSTATATATTHPAQPHIQRAPPLEHFRQTLSIPISAGSTLSTCYFDPKQQARSISFDEIRTNEQVTKQDSIAEETGSRTPSPCLEVPGATSSKSARSKSFDSATAAALAQQEAQQRTRAARGPQGSFLEIPKWKMLIRRSSAGVSGGNSSPCGEAFCRDCIHCVLLVEYTKGSNLSPPPSAKGSMSSEGSQDADCEESEPEGHYYRSPSASGESVDDEEYRNSPSPIPLVTLSIAPDNSCDDNFEDYGNGITVISLEVPVLPKSGRSASVDSSYLKVPQRTDIGCCELPPSKNIRSRSVDIALPVGPDGPYIVVPNEKPIPQTTQ